MAKFPSASVIIPFFNAEAYLNKCLKSLSDQDIKEPFEVLMINDCSRDNSLKIIENFNTLNIKIFSLTFIVYIDYNNSIINFNRARKCR